MRSLISILLTVLCVMVVPNLTHAADPDQKSTLQDNQKLDQELAQEFNVPKRRIDALRAQKLGYGEIRHVLTLSKQMPGGIDDANIDKIMGMRNNHEGWGRISQDLGVKLQLKEKEPVEIHGNANIQSHADEHAENHMPSSPAGMLHMSGGMGHGH
ncbi:MAG: hypothetical protein KGJ09_04985 [Candidatus Omnitrophica bacterium]|nr:hypothetical protein [Candidatus Omnitrophota bacterium]MDE2027837.1 hypothetical protein [Candidatus Omnitrophota bacterium]MDE2215501.1 hypothetical protein [Candidatus Omnitrophota bacterium]